MNPLDIGVIAVVALSAIFAFARGFVREALSIVAWVGAAVITIYGFNWAYAEVEPHVHDRLLAQVIAGFGLFVASLVVLTVLTGLVARVVQFSGLTPIDRTLGFLFGLARGAFLVCLAYLLLDLSLPQVNERPQWIRTAKSDPYLHEGADVLKGFLPDSLKAKGAEAADALKSFNPAGEAKKARDALVNPAPAGAKPDAASPPANYPPNEQRQLDRVINNNQR
ncbi:MAG TPA: CvpA family protein [Stellaceae bacterium]|nr:CvpA family protein [Stellaceae bacterium]